MRFCLQFTIHEGHAVLIECVSFIERSKGNFLRKNQESKQTPLNCICETQMMPRALLVAIQCTDGQMKGQTDFL